LKIIKKLTSRLDYFDVQQSLGTGTMVAGCIRFID
jgi:hypothetical protein